MKKGYRGSKDEREWKGPERMRERELTTTSEKICSSSYFYIK